MTKPTRHQKRNRIYTHWGKNVTEVKTLHQEKVEKKVETAPPVPVETDQKTSQVSYNNLAIINFNLDNFILDFIALSPDKRKGKVTNRIIASPRRIKQLRAALEESIKKYEERFGPIKN
ncbi:MAG: DUF3467 domain-containing protein [Elusimicrobiota bacterium]